MENTSKVLLIAVAVLVAVILITVGMKIYLSTIDTQKVADNTGKSISEKTQVTTNLLEDLMSKNHDKYIETSVIKDLKGTTWKLNNTISHLRELHINGIIKNDKYKFWFDYLGTRNVLGYQVFVAYWYNGIEHPYNNDEGFCYIPQNNIGFPSNTWTWIDATQYFQTNDPSTLSVIHLIEAPTIEIKGGSDINNIDVINWLKENAVLISST